MTNYSGYMGKVLLLDLTTRRSGEYPWSDRDRELYIGGKAMASKILFDNLTGSEDPLGPENLIVIATGPLTGTGAPSSNRFDISALSPLTGITSSSNCGGNFGHYLKKAGFDALILKGKCETPTWIEIEDEKITFHDAAALQNLRTTETQEEMQKLLDEAAGKKVRCGMLAIGPAGEHLVRYACVMSGERAAGRAGMGAVFGSKNIKGMTVTGAQMASVYDKEKTNEFHKKWINTIRNHPITGERLPKEGTATLLNPMHEHSILATRNFGRGTYEYHDDISGETLAETLHVGNNGCLTCPIRCSRRVPVDGKIVKGPELETLGLLGGNVENRDLELICRWNYALDELGMDTISCAGTVAWAMEANEKGLWDSGLQFGKTDNIEQVFEDIAFRRGVGNELAEGSKRLSEKYGGAEFAIQSKGMELSAYEPRRAVGQGLGYAVSNRGGCHLNGGYLVVLEGLGMDVNGLTPSSKADLCMIMQDLMESISMGGQCLFTSFAVFPGFTVKDQKKWYNRMLYAVVPFVGPVVRVLNRFPEIAFFQLPLIPYTYEYPNIIGMKMSIGKLIRAGERSYNVERAVNARFGVSAESDKLPKRLTDSLQDTRNGKTRVPLERMKKVYYRARGWQKNGLPSEGKLRRLGIRHGSVESNDWSVNTMLKKAYYRVFQAVFNVGARCLYWRRPIEVSGPGSAKRAAELCKKEKVTKAMIVTGPSVGKKLAPLITASLDEAGIAWYMFAEVEANPSVNTVEKIRALYVENGCNGFIAIGGGSPMDAAKAAAARIVRPNTPVGKMAGLLRVMKKLPPFIAVPTTAGTGSETTIAAVITDSETHHKYALMDLHLVPKYAILDPEMTRGLPPKITAATGMDALTHAVEAYVCWTYNTKESLKCAEDATVAIFKYLERAYQNGDDMEARTEMLRASFNAGFAFTRAGVGNVHAIAHTLGGLYNTPHGLANAVILPIVLEDYGAAVYPRLSRLAELTGVKTDGTQQEKAEAFIREIRAMNQRMDIPTGFDHIQEKDIPQMIEWALHEANPVYPVPVVYDKKRCEKVIRRIIAEA